MAKKSIISGYVSAVYGQVILVSFTSSTLPEQNHILTSPEHPDVRLEVFSYRDHHTVACLSLSSSELLYRGMKIISTEKPLIIPVGHRRPAGRFATLS